MFFFIAVIGAVLAIVLFFTAALLLTFGGLWLGIAATAIYFIVTQWPELAVVIPCFISLALAALGGWTSYYWYDEISDWILVWCYRACEGVKDIFPTRWTLDTVDDDDLAKEGIETYARQAMVLSSA